jgi:hypothetical protein
MVLFLLVCFSDRVMHFCLALDHGPPISASWVTGIKDVCHHTQLFYIFFFFAVWGIKPGPYEC